MSKVCYKCKISKDCELFSKDKKQLDGLQIWCKECCKKYREENKEKGRIWWEKYYEENKKTIHLRNNLYRKNRRLIDPSYDKAPKQSRELKRLYENDLLKRNKQFKLRKLLRTRLKDALKGRYKNGSAVKLLGCTIEELYKHLESLFQEGMTWENQGFYGWHIDHIQPLSKFNLEDPEQLKIVCHYTNLQPLWAKDNIRKGNKCTLT